MSAISSSQKGTGLVCGLSTRKMRTPCDIQCRTTRRISGVEALVVAVEIDRVDVLVLLRRVLGVGDRAVALGREPLGVLLRPRVVGGALQREVQRDLHAEPCAPAATKSSKSSSVPRSGWTASWPPKREPIAHGLPGSLGPGSRVLFGPLRLISPIGRDRRQVDDVEAQVGDGRQALGGLLEGARARRVEARPLRAREELVPGREQRALAVDGDLVRRAGGQQLTQRVRLEGRDEARSP